MSTLPLLTNDSPNAQEKISRHFSAREFWCRHCHKLQIALPLLEALEELRTSAGVVAEREVRITVNSGYRCPYWNKRVGGSPNSQHVQGLAADIWSADLPLLQLYQLALTIPALRAGGIGVYPEARPKGFIHVDLARQRRWGWLGGKMVSLQSALERLENDSPGQ